MATTDTPLTWTDPTVASYLSLVFLAPVLTTILSVLALMYFHPRLLRPTYDLQ